VTIPDRRRTASLDFVLRRVRDTIRVTPRHARGYLVELCRVGNGAGALLYLNIACARRCPPCGAAASVTGPARPAFERRLGAPLPTLRLIVILWP
jgi:hypothetical protein